MKTLLVIAAVIGAFYLGNKHASHEYDKQIESVQQQSSIMANKAYTAAKTAACDCH